MFGLDAAQDKRIVNRIDWLTACLVIVMQRIGELFNLKFPAPPEE